LHIFDNVTLMPMLSQSELWREFARSMVSVSVSVHDGTPNSLLEAMAVGCLPVCGDIESIREWITDGENGLLVDPADPTALLTPSCAELKTKACAVSLPTATLRSSSPALKSQPCAGRWRNFTAG